MHITFVVGFTLNGVILVITPLLTLSAHHMAKFTVGDGCYGTIDAHHMDELRDTSPQKYRGLLCVIAAQSTKTTSTYFLVVSPQFFANYPEFCEAMVQAGLSCTLRLVIMDEVHLHIQHGSSFHDNNRQLKEIFLYQMSSSKTADVLSV